MRGPSITQVQHMHRLSNIPNSAKAIKEINDADVGLIFEMVNEIWRSYPS